MSGKDLQKLWDETPRKPEVVLFQPVWKPYNAAAKELVQHILDGSGLQQSGKMGQKYRTIIREECSLYASVR